MNSLILQNNRQIFINQAIDKRIQEITDITNQVLKIENERTKNHSIEINQLIVLSNLDSLQNQVETLEEAILMAKHGIPSSKLLSMRDFNRIAAFLQTHDVQITSFEELLSQSKAQVNHRTTFQLYIREGVFQRTCKENQRWDNPYQRRRRRSYIQLHQFQSAAKRIIPHTIHPVQSSHQWRALLQL